MTDGNGRKTLHPSAHRVKARGTCTANRGLNPRGVCKRVGAAHPLHCKPRNARASAGRMPRNAGQEIEVQEQPLERGDVQDFAAALPDLPYVRLTQRVRPPPDRRGLWMLLALVLAAHVVLVWVGWRILRPAPVHYDDRGVISVSLIEPSASLPAPPPMPAPPPLPGQPARAAPPSRPLHYVPPAKGAMQATMEGVKGPPLSLYQANGQIRTAPASAAPAPAYSTPGIQGSQIYSGKSPVPYKPTRFNQDWAPDHETLGAKTVGRAVDKAIEKTTVKKTVHLPGGIKLHCALSPLALFAGCKGDDPQPPPKNDDDIRLSMPPPETLTGKKVVVPASASSVPPPSAAATSGH